MASAVRDANASAHASARETKRMKSTVRTLNSTVHSLNSTLAGAMREVQWMASAVRDANASAHTSAKETKRMKSTVRTLNKTVHSALQGFAKDIGIIKNEILAMNNGSALETRLLAME